jgi:hypothetical protein
MILPTQYPYNPSRRLIIFGLVGGAAYLVVMALVCSCKPGGIVLWLGIALTMLGLLLAVRRLAFKCHLLLDTDALTLPSGLLKVRTVRVLYKDIERVWEIRLPLKTGAIMIAANGRKFEVLSTLLPYTSSYIEVGDFLYSKAQENRKY